MEKKSHSRRLRPRGHQLTVSLPPRSKEESTSAGVGFVGLRVSRRKCNISSPISVAEAILRRRSRATTRRTFRHTYCTHVYIHIYVAAADLTGSLSPSTFSLILAVLIIRERSQERKNLPGCHYVYSDGARSNLSRIPSCLRWFFYVSVFFLCARACVYTASSSVAATA